MKKIKYTFHGIEAEMDWSEANEAIAAREADNGIEITPDDGQPEPEAPGTPEGDDLTADEMAAAILEGVNEV